MRRRICALLLALGVTLSSALAAGETEGVEARFPVVRAAEPFIDVGGGDWYAPYAELCCETGLMNGTGAGRFSPGAALTAGEAEALAARLHHMLNGGDGVLPEAPAGTGTIALTVGGVENPRWDTIRTGGGGFEVILPWAGDPEDPAALPAAFVLVDGAYRLEAGVEHHGAGELLLTFPVDGALFRQCDPVSRLSTGGLGGQKALDAWYWAGDRYLKQLPGAEEAAFQGDLTGAVSRGGFLSLLNLVCPDGLLAPVNEISVLPDTARPEVLRFYRAGILTGVDEYGAFQADGALSRAEAAATLARIVRPGLRLPLALEPDGLPYTLTPLLAGDRPLSVTARTADSPEALRLEALYPSYVLEELPPLLDVRVDQGGVERVGLMDWAGGWLLPPAYDAIDPFLTDGLARVRRDGRYGYVNLQGEEVLPCRYACATYVHDGAVAVGDRADALTAYDAAGRKLADLPAGAEGSSTLGGCLAFQEEGRWGLLSAKGEVLIPAQYARLAVEFDGAVVAMDERGNVGLLDTGGSVVVPFLYPRLYNSPDEEGYVVVGTAGDNASPLHYNGKKGMIDRSGTVVIPLEYDYLTPFDHGKADFIRGEAAGHLLPDGTEVPGPNPLLREDPEVSAAPEGDLLAQWLHLTRPHQYRLITDIVDDRAVVALGGDYYLLTLSTP